MFLSVVMTCYWILNKSNTTGATSGAGTAYHFGAPVFKPGFSWVSVSEFSLFCVVSCGSWFVFLYLLSFDLRFSGYPISITKLALLLYSVYSPSTNIYRYYVTLIYKTITLLSKNYYFYSFFPFYKNK